MRKLLRKLLSLCIIIMLFTSTSLCFGETRSEEGIEPKFVGTFLHIESFTEGSGATLVPKAILKPKEDNSFDKVIINIKIKKVSTGTEYFNKSFAPHYDTVRNWYCATTDFTAPSKGTYRMDSTYKCYKGGKLIETLKGDPKTATY
ncbi:hypothetical protein AALA24_01015 [Anaerovoracaceae bacterium 42-11]